MALPAFSESLGNTVTNMLPRAPTIRPTTTTNLRPNLKQTENNDINIKTQIRFN